MIALRILAVLILIAAIWFFVTQILFPVLNSKPLFPAFCKQSDAVKSLEREVSDLHDKVSDLSDARDLKRTKDALVREKKDLEQVLTEDDGPFPRKQTPSEQKESS